MLDNYFLNEGELSQEENIAFRVFIDQKIKKEKSEQTFESSPEFQQMQTDILFQELSPGEKNAIGYLITNYSLSKEEKQTVKTTQKARVLLSRYNKLYTKRITSWLRENDPLINAALFKYGWAITVHKAIGSSFDEIIMKAQRGEHSGITNTDYFRWLYSGISTAERMVAISCPQYIHPLMKCYFEDSTFPAPVSVKVKTPGHSLRTFDNYDIESRFKEKLEALENKNVIAAICELSKMLEQKGYLLESTRQHTVYMTKAIYSLPGAIDKQLIFNIDNKSATKNWAVSSIRIEKADSPDNAYIEECIRNFFQTSPLPSETPSIVTNLPTDFRKSIYSQWFRTFEENGLKVNIINAYDHQDIFLEKKEHDVIKFKVWYSTSEQQKTKGFINKIEVIEKTNEELSLQIKKLLLNE